MLRNNYDQLQKGTDPEVARVLEVAYDYVSSVGWLEGQRVGTEQQSDEFEATPKRRILNGFGTSREGERSVTIGNTTHKAEDAIWLAREAVTSCIDRFEQNAGWKLTGEAGSQRIQPEERLRIQDPGEEGGRTSLWIHRKPTKVGTRTTLRRVPEDATGRSANWPGHACRLGTTARHVVRQLGEWNAREAAAREAN